MDIIVYELGHVFLEQVHGWKLDDSLIFTEAL